MATGRRFKEYSPRDLIIEYKSASISPVPLYSSTPILSHGDQFQVIFRFTGRHIYRQWIIWPNSTELDPWIRSSIELSPKMIKLNLPPITSTQKKRTYRALNQGLIGYRLSISDRKNLARQVVEEAWNILVTRSTYKVKLHLHIDFTLIHRQVANRNANYRVDIRDLERDPLYNGTYTRYRGIILGDAHPSNTTMVPTSQASIESLKKEIIVDGSCSICLEDFVVGCDKGVCMPCSHIFHGDCIARWLSTSQYCPLCRFQMPTSSST